MVTPLTNRSFFLVGNCVTDRLANRSYYRILVDNTARRTGSTLRTNEIAQSRLAQLKWQMTNVTGYQHSRMCAEQELGVFVDNGLDQCPLVVGFTSSFLDELGDVDLLAASCFAASAAAASRAFPQPLTRTWRLRASFREKLLSQ